MLYARLIFPYNNWQVSNFITQIRFTDIFCIQSYGIKLFWTNIFFASNPTQMVITEHCPSHVDMSFTGGVSSLSRCEFNGFLFGQNLVLK